MSGEKNLEKLIKTMEPKLNKGEYVFCNLKNGSKFNFDKAVLIFKEDEGVTVIVTKDYADKLGMSYTFISSWITLNVHSALDAVGLTAAFSSALTKQNISCNVVAGYYHDHIFVDKNDAVKAMLTLKNMTL